MTDVKISVATVALNAARDLPLTIESIAGQTYANVEYIVVDGCSSDDSVRILERYSDVIDKLLFVEDSGIYDAMHTAVANATGDYIIFINAGDRFYSEDILQNVVSRIVGSPDILYGNHIYKDGGLEYFKSSMDFRTIRERLLYGEIDSRWHDRIPGHQATFVKPSLFKSLDFDSTFDICADHDFLFRAYDAGAEMQYVDEIISFYMAGGFSSRNAAKLRREWALAYRRCSLVPGAVDSFIFNKERSPFPPYTAFSGYIVSGKHEWEGPLYEGDFIGFACWASVLEIISPSKLSTTGMRIKGKNLFPDQEICLIHDGVRIASVSVPVGEFDVSLSFSRILPRGSHVILRSQTVDFISDEDRRLVGFFLKRFMFQLPEGFDFVPDHVVDVSPENSEYFERALLGGWNDVESLIGLVWSKEKQCAIALNFDRNPEELVFHVDANPFGKKDYEIEIVLNEEYVGTTTIVAGTGSGTLSLTKENGLLPGLNIVQFRTKTLTKAPPDTRLLGFALRRFEWK